MYLPQFDPKRPQPGDKELAAAIREGINRGPAMISDDLKEIKQFMMASIDRHLGTVEDYRPRLEALSDELQTLSGEARTRRLNAVRVLLTAPLAHFDIEYLSSLLLERGRISEAERDQAMRQRELYVTPALRDGYWETALVEAQRIREPLLDKLKCTDCDGCDGC